MAEVPDIPVLGCVGQLDAWPCRVGIWDWCRRWNIRRWKRLYRSGRGGLQGADLDRLRRLATAGKTMASRRGRDRRSVNVAVAKDEASLSVTPILDEWREAGAEFGFSHSPTSAGRGLRRGLPAGRLPRTSGGQNPMNETFMSGLRGAGGKAVFGECGGYMALGEAPIAEDGQTTAWLVCYPWSRALNLKAHPGLPASGSDRRWTGARGARSNPRISLFARVSRDQRDPLFREWGARRRTWVAGCRHGRVAGSFCISSPASRSDDGAIFPKPKEYKKAMMASATTMPNVV